MGGLAKRFAAAVAALCAAGSACAAPAGETMKWNDLLSRPKPQTSVHVAYGADPLQHVDVWLPDRAGPHPVVLMIHGGCWQTSVADATLMNYAAEDLRQRGIAVWNIEYRGVDRPGGGYPGTFHDVAAAADALRANAARYQLDIRNVVAFGHSAGGHLGLWLAARERIARASVLHAADPLRIATMISAGGLPDLRAAQTPPGDTCGAEAVHALTGAPTAVRPDVYADTSPPELQPFAATQVQVNAARDRIAPPAFAAAYAKRARAKRVAVRNIVVPDEGHVELIAPGSASWALEVGEIERALGRAAAKPTRSPG